MSTPNGGQSPYAEHSNPPPMQPAGGLRLLPAYAWAVRAWVTNLIIWGPLSLICFIGLSTRFWQTFALLAVPVLISLAMQQTTVRRLKLDEISLPGFAKLLVLAFLFGLFAGGFAITLFFVFLGASMWRFDPSGHTPEQPWYEAGTTYVLLGGVLIFTAATAFVAFVPFAAADGRTSFGSAVTLGLRASVRNWFKVFIAVAAPYALMIVAVWNDLTMFPGSRYLTCGVAALVFPLLFLALAHGYRQVTEGFPLIDATANPHDR